MNHVEAINAVLNQFDSYNSDCFSCEKSVDGSCGRLNCVKDMDGICDDNNLICREKLLLAAEECDGEEECDNCQWYRKESNNVGCVHNLGTTIKPFSKKCAVYNRR